MTLPVRADASGCMGLVFLSLLLVGCQTATEALDVDDVRKTRLVESECAVYFTVRKQLLTQNRAAPASMTEGCPPATADIAADITPQESPPEIESRFGRIIFQRMVARGMPRDVAEDVSLSPAFYDLVTQSDALYGGN